MIRTLAVDCPYLLKRSFNGAKDVYTDNFGHIGGLYGFFTTLRRLIIDYQINKVILAWDGENSGYYRHIIEPSYKSNRDSKEWYNKIELSEYEIKREEEKKKSLLKQKVRIQQYAEELFLRQIEVDKIEADDIIAAYCKEYHEKEDIIVYTNDRDFSQLLDYDIKIKFGNIDDVITKTNFFFQFGYSYKNSLTIKILCGDKSDNLEGIKNLGEKTLINHFPDLRVRRMTVKEICSIADKINKERVENKKKPLKVFENLLSNVDLLRTNHKLMNLESPMLNEEAELEMKELALPLLDDDRSSKNLYKLMQEDGFLEIYNGSYVDYIKPFSQVVVNEKKLLKEYNSKS